LTALVAGWAPAQTAAGAVDGTVKDGAGLALVGAIAEGRVSYAGGMSGAGEAVRWRLEHVHMKVGNVDVPLRSNQSKGGDGALVYRQLGGGEDYAGVVCGPGCGGGAGEVNCGAQGRCPGISNGLQFL
jgi:hypothetical protein